ncbi:MAG: hypothetical protein ACRCUX_08225 [Beijerinckiaceae bacterium]
MPDVVFKPHPDSPGLQIDRNEQGMFWKLTVREWTFNKFLAENVASDFKLESNNPGVVPPRGSGPPDGRIRWSPGVQGGAGTGTFFARMPGFTLIHFQDAGLNTVKPMLQVEVKPRRSNNQKGVSLTTLQGSTYAIQAPDTRTYTMDKTEVFTAASADDLFNGVPEKTDHVVLSSHGGVVGNETEIRLFVAGVKRFGVVVDSTNATKVFSKLKSKMTANGVIWIGGCTAAQNNLLCQRAAEAAGVPVIAPGMALLDTTYPKNKIDGIDRFCSPKAFVPQASLSAYLETLPGTTLTSPIFVGDFCARQAFHKFVVPT